ncbi:hypothetical protein HPB48_015647 [Haemaphysalis longicornis]|uniref:Uncharacterized protein n=1 Tax=Haemaphysalis longicornis TaxID=44386 RepID=A0A9J6GVV9_HAELO|nr:hypothetical protein HPB48_015647 [Haemaphysalis longicornis]
MTFAYVAKNRKGFPKAFPGGLNSQKGASGRRPFYTPTTGAFVLQTNASLHNTRGLAKRKLAARQVHRYTDFGHRIPSEGVGREADTSAEKTRKRDRRCRTAVYDGFTLCALRNIVRDLFRRNEPPTAQKIAEEFLRSEPLPNLRTWTIRRLLSDIGFVFEKRERNSMMIEGQDLLIWRQRYLRQITEYRQQHRKIGTSQNGGDTLMCLVALEMARDDSRHTKHITHMPGWLDPSGDQLCNAVYLGPTTQGMDNMQDVTSGAFRPTDIALCTLSADTVHVSDA